jgi:hypothetical protein
MKTTPNVNIVYSTNEPYPGHHGGQMKNTTFGKKLD